VPCGEKAEEYSLPKKKIETEAMQEREGEAESGGRKRGKGKEFEKGAQHLQFCVAHPLASPLLKVFIKVRVL
jgi:hypothetical protein